METTNYHIYTDASFSKNNLTAVTGFILFESDDSHRKEESQPIQTKTFKERNNIRAELEGVIFALEEVTKKKGGQKNLYTDCESIAKLLQRRERLESSAFLSKKTKKPLNNADLYKRFFALCDRINPKVIWVKGHSRFKDRDLVRRNFSRVDKAVRKILRETVN